MPASSISVFGEPEDFCTAMRANGVGTLIVSGVGKFSARLARISLHRMRLFAGEEHLSRAASVSVASRFVRVSLPAEPATSLIWNGIPTRPNEITTHGARHRFTELTDGPSRWSTIWLKEEELARSAHTMTGCRFVVPPGECRWQPMPEALRLLVSLHGSAIRAIATQAKLPVQKEAARGLEEQMLLALTECLVESPPVTKTHPGPGASAP
jgi:hypothetical protein